DLAMSRHLPTVHQTREFVEAGGLMAYGPSIFSLGERAAWYTDRILKGTRPADLPVEQPAKFKLVVNLKIAKVLGLTLPATVLATADEVIDEVWPLPTAIAAPAQGYKRLPRGDWAGATRDHAEWRSRDFEPPLLHQHGAIFFTTCDAPPPLKLSSNRRLSLTRGGRAVSHR